MLVLAAVTTAWAPGAFAQTTLPANVVTAAGTLTGEQREMVKAHVARFAADLKSDKAETVQKARAEILIPLQEANVGVSFRNAYASELKPIIDPLVRSDSDVIAVNALRIAGKLAHRDAASALDTGLKAQKVAIRYAAMAGVGDTFDALARSAPAIDINAAKQLVRGLRPILAGEADSNIFDAGVRALISASVVDRDGWGSLRDDAISELGQVISDRIQKLAKQPADSTMMQALIRGVSAGRDALAGGGKRLGENTQKSAAAMAGDALAYVQSLVQAQHFPVIQANDAENVQAERTAARVAPANLASVATTSIFFANDGLGGGQLPQAQLDLSQLLRSAKSADDAKFLVGVRDLIGPNGALAKPPFGFEANRFLK